MRCYGTLLEMKVAEGFRLIDTVISYYIASNHVNEAYRIPIRIPLSVRSSKLSGGQLRQSRTMLTASNIFGEIAALHLQAGHWNRLGNSTLLALAV